MSDTQRSTTGDSETGLWTAVSALALLVFFVGCGCFTMADIFLGSNNTVSAVLAIVGVPLFVIGGIVLVLRSRVGEPAAPQRG